MQREAGALSLKKVERRSSAREAARSYHSGWLGCIQICSWVGSRWMANRAAATIFAKYHHHPFTNLLLLESSPSLPLQQLRLKHCIFLVMPAASAEPMKRQRAAEAASTQQDPQGTTDAQLNLSPSASNEGEIEADEEEEVFSGAEGERKKLQAAGRANKAVANNFSSLLGDKIRGGQDCSNLTLPPIASTVPTSKVVANSAFGERWFYPDGRVVIPILPHGEPTFEKVSASLSHDAKSRLCYEAIARQEYSGVPKYNWPLQLAPVEVRARSTLAASDRDTNSLSLSRRCQAPWMRFLKVPRHRASK